jgi:hypothetical protein
VIAPQALKRLAEAPQEASVIRPLFLWHDVAVRLQQHRIVQYPLNDMGAQPDLEVTF